MQDLDSGGGGTQPGTKGHRVLVVDDEPAILEEYLHSLGANESKRPERVSLINLEQELFGRSPDRSPMQNFEIEMCNQGIDAVRAVKRAVELDDPFAVVFLDVRMPPGLDGVETAERIRAIDPHVNIVIVTGSTPAEPEKLAQRIPPVDRLFLFQKPFHAVECHQLTSALCSKWRADRTLRRSHELLEQRVTQRTAQLHQLAFYDPATGLPNRNKLLQDLDQLISSARRSDNMVGVLLMDIDRFSFLNETLGYESGTRLLNAVADRLSRAVRGTDIAGRFGSDEFACLVGNIENQDGVQDVVDRVKELFNQPFRVEGRELFVNVCVGVASYPLHGQDADEVFRCAEAALHRSKRHVIRETIFYDREMGEFARRKLELEAELRDAIAAQEIRPYIQPQICLRTGKVSGAEALARWIKADGSVVSPAEFVPLAEEVGLTGALFETMLRQLVTHIAEWKRHTAFSLPASINISAHELRDPGFADLVLSVLQSKGLAPEALKLELTETVLLDDLTVAKRFFSDLVSHGVGVQIDDFGTGYSSLSYLAELPVQSLKIDRVFVSRLLEESSQARVVQAVIALGRAFNVAVVAEGVEEQAQLDYLRQNDCDYAQGYLIAKPMPPAEFLDWLAQPETRRRRSA